MKGRLLKKILNNTQYSVSNHTEYIAVGSPMCHDLFSVNKKTLRIRYALDTWREGRKCLEGKSNEELLFIYDKLHELVNSGEIQEIINGKDDIENPLPVYTVRNGKLIESFTDEYGWPNCDDEGYTMYENTHFDNPKQALQYGIKEAEAGISISSRRISDLESELKKAKEGNLEFEKEAEYLQSLLKKYTDTTNENN